MVREIIRRQRHDGSPGKQPDPGRGKLCSFCCHRNAGGGRSVTDSLENKRRIGVHFYFAPYDTGNYSGYGADGIFLYAESALRNAYPADRTYGVLRSLYIDGSKSKAGGHGSFP